MKVLRTTVITAAGGLLVAFVLFMLTAPSFTYLGPVGRPDGTDFVNNKADVSKADVSATTISMMPCCHLLPASNRASWRAVSPKSIGVGSP